MKTLTPSNVLGNECKALAAELVKQPELLAGVFLDSATALPSSQQIVGAVKEYTGTRSTTADDRLLMVGALRLLGASDREIERSCGVTRRSIPVMLAELEASGRVTPLKDRLVKLVGDNAERSSLLLRALMERGLDGICNIDLAAMIKAVGSVNSFQVEKFQLLTGQATEIVETRTGAGREEVERWWREMATPIKASVESESTALQGNTADSAMNPAADTSLIPDAAEKLAGTKEGGGGSVAPGAAEEPMV